MKKAAPAPTARPRLRRILAASATPISPEAEGANDPLFISALARGLAILRCCGDSQTDLTVSDIAHTLGISQSTAWRSCYTLLKLGFLVRTGNDRVRPGLPLLGLGYAALSRQPMAELARQSMEEIALRFRGAMSLGTREGFEILYLQRVDGGPVIYPGLRPGSRVTLLASAMGWAYLAALPLDQRKEFLSSAKQHSPELYGRIQSRLEKAFRDFAQRGYIVNSGLIHPELSAIAFPVAVSGELPKAALSFGGLKSIFSIQRLERELAPQLQSLAKMLSITQC